MNGLRVLPLLLLGSALAGAEVEPVAIGPGTTWLGDLGSYSGGMEPEGVEPIELPVGWLSDMDSPRGAAYQPGVQMLGRTAMFFHVPWRGVSGPLWIDYALALPDLRPLTLHLGHTLSPQAAAPGRSDGVTFTAFLFAPSGERRRLLQDHDQAAEWSDESFDLSEYAGQTVRLRLQVHPGPAGNASFDFSYWDGRIVAGEAGESDAPTAAALAARPAYQAVAGRDLAPLLNRAGGGEGVWPPAFLPQEHSLSVRGGAYVFRATAADASLEWVWRPTTGTLDDLTVEVDGGAPFQPAAGGGVTFDLGEGPVRGVGGEALRTHIDREARTVSVDWRYPASQGGATVRWRLGLAGRALTVSAESDELLAAAFSLGQVAGVDRRRGVQVPYLAGTLFYLPTPGLYTGRWLDWTKSNASRAPQGEAAYHAKTDGTRNPLREEGYVAVSPHLAETLPNLPHPVSPYRELLAPLIVLDIWGHQPGGYAGDADLLRRLKDRGVDHMIIIQHDWQRYGYDVKLPDHLPANPAYGGDEGMKLFGDTARELGYPWSVHENYIDLYPDAPSYEAHLRALEPDGSPALAWFNEGTGVQSYTLKPNHAMRFVRQTSPEIHRRFGTTASYLDVNMSAPPWIHLEHDAGQPLAAMARGRFAWDTELFALLRRAHGGPLLGEGNNHFYWGGRVDGVEAQVAEGELHTPLLDFDLLRLQPQMVNHGMGYLERWFQQGYNANFGTNVGTYTDLDRYRAQTVAYGHAGFIGAALVGREDLVAKEHHLLTGVQRLVHTARPTAIEYWVEDRFVPASVAVALGDTWRQRVRYSNGLTVWVNWAAEPWAIEGHTLPQWGWRASGPGTDVGTALREGRVVDWARTPEFTYADARTSFLGEAYVRRHARIEPKLARFRYLGGDQIELTYEWHVEQDLDRDYNVLVHFNNDAVSQWGGDHIVFQGDHAAPRPTSTWRAGEVIVDGPHTVTVSPEYDTYDITIGLHDGRRLPLVGPRATLDRILLGRLAVTRDGEQVTRVRLVELSDEERAAPEGPDFGERVNPAGTRVEVERLRTDGAARVVWGRRQATVWPYPRDTEFSVSLELGAAARRARVRALSAGEQADLGAVEASAADGWLTFRAGRTGAGRYVVTW